MKFHKNMKPIFNRNKKNSVINNRKNCKRRRTVNQNFKTKIEKINIDEIPSIFKPNKTLQKYINQKLNLITSNQIKKNTKNYNTKPFKYIKSKSLNITNKNKKDKKNELNKINNNGNGRNKKKIKILYKKYNPNKIYSSYNNLSLPKDINIIQNKSKSPMQTKGKLISEKNYNSSISTGITINSNGNELFKTIKNVISFREYRNKDEEEDDFLPHFNFNFGSNSNEDRNKNNSMNNYEIDSSRDNIIDNKIYKGNDNISYLTFGNSFSYTNSKRSCSTSKKLINNDYDEDIFILKNQNETLKKELKESNEQINLLKNEIEKLIKNTKIKSYKHCFDFENRFSLPLSYIKKSSLNDSNFKQELLNINNYKNQKMNGKNNLIIKNKKF